MLTAIIPDPDYYDGAKRKELHGDTPAELSRAVREWIELSCYGASAIGAIFNVFRDGNLVATVCYNGRFDWRDPLYDPANPQHSIRI